MRRKDREVADRAGIEAIIAKADVCRLGLIDGDRPYIVPLSFGYRDNTLYFHCAPKGLKLDLIAINPKVGFEMDMITELVTADEACDWGIKYQSVIGSGQAALIENDDEKRAALDVIMAQYSDKTYTFSDAKLKATAVIKVEIDQMTGKQAG